MKKIKISNDTVRYTKKLKLLSNPNIRRWYDNLARGSPLTAEGHLRRLGRFCEMHQMTPIHLVDIALQNLRTATDLLEDHITMMESQGYSPGYIKNQINTIKSWLKHSDIEIRRKMRIASASFTPTLQNERVPESHELSEIYGAAGLRESAIISLMAKSGLRPEVLGNHNGTDGLQIRDMPNLVIHQGRVKCIRTPNKIIVRRELSKTNHQYFTFTTSTATGHIIDYLNDRLAHGELLCANSPVITPNTHKTGKGKRSKKLFLPTQRISEKVRQTFRPRFTWRPYVLRAYFDTQLLIAESKGKMAHDFRVFFMGHKGTMESRYTTNKGILPEMLTAEMCEAFMRSEQYLDQTHMDSLLDQKQKALNMIEYATSQQIEQILGLLTNVNHIKQLQ